jgi:hypothetical protein
MAARKEGFLVYFDAARAEQVLIDPNSDIPSPFTDALSIRDWEVGKISVALLGFSDKTINYICLAKRGKTVVTAKQRIEFSSFVSLDSIPVIDVEGLLGSDVKRYFIKASSGVGGSFPPATWTALLNVLKELRPHLAAEIERVLALQHLSGIKLVGAVADIAMQEREALGISLDIFSGGSSLRDEVLSQWSPREEEVSLHADGETGTLGKSAQGSAFMEGLPARFIQEESALQHDLFNWPGMTPTHHSGTSVFQQGSRRLEVIYANRNALESTLGVDLIYYNSEFEMFALVQYKLMKEESGEMVYRPDKGFRKELARMDSIYQTTRNNDPIQKHEHFRLNDDGFLFKFVPNKGIHAASGELIRGMYCTRQYVHFLLGSYGPKGPQDGSKISFKGAPRYLTNSQFTDAVHHGWLGSQGLQSCAIYSIVREYYETGRAVVFSREMRV